MYDNETVYIPYTEYKAIGELLRAHLTMQNVKLRAMIAFGNLVTKGNTYDIDLLEVVEGWQGQSFVSFGNSAELPLRGQLRLYFLTPQEFEHPSSITKEVLRRAMERVQEGYDVVYEDPPVYALDTLARPEPETTGSNPLNFLATGGLRER